MSWRDDPRLALRCCWVLATFSHTSPWLLLIFAAIRSFLLARYDFELENECTSSPARRCHLPLSTQNDGIGTRPDFAGNTKSTPRVRSWRPPFTTSPACT